MELLVTSMSGGVLQAARPLAFGRRCITGLYHGLYGYWSRATGIVDYLSARRSTSTSVRTLIQRRSSTMLPGSQHLLSHTSSISHAFGMHGIYMDAWAWPIVIIMLSLAMCKSYSSALQLNVLGAMSLKCHQSLFRLSWMCGGMQAQSGAYIKLSQITWCVVLSP